MACGAFAGDQVYTDVPSVPNFQPKITQLGHDESGPFSSGIVEWGQKNFGSQAKYTPAWASADLYLDPGDGVFVLVSTLSQGALSQTSSIPQSLLDAIDLSSGNFRAKYVNHHDEDGLQFDVTVTLTEAPPVVWTGPVIPGAVSGVPGELIVDFDTLLDPPYLSADVSVEFGSNASGIRVSFDVGDGVFVDLGSLASGSVQDTFVLTESQRQAIADATGAPRVRLQNDSIGEIAVISSEVTVVQGDGGSGDGGSGDGGSGDGGSGDGGSGDGGSGDGGSGDGGSGDGGSGDGPDFGGGDSGPGVRSNPQERDDETDAPTVDNGDKTDGNGGIPQVIEVLHMSASQWHAYRVGRHAELGVEPGYLQASKAIRITIDTNLFPDDKHAEGWDVDLWVGNANAPARYRTYVDGQVNDDGDTVIYVEANFTVVLFKLQVRGIYSMQRKYGSFWSDQYNSFHDAEAFDFMDITHLGGRNFGVNLGGQGTDSLEHFGRDYETFIYVNGVKHPANGVTGIFVNGSDLMGGYRFDPLSYIIASSEADFPDGSTIKFEAYWGATDLLIESETLTWVQEQTVEIVSSEQYGMLAQWINRQALFMQDLTDELRAESNIRSRSLSLQSTNVSAILRCSEIQEAQRLELKRIREFLTFELAGGANAGSVDSDGDGVDDLDDLYPDDETRSEFDEQSMVDEADEASESVTDALVDFTEYSDLNADEAIPELVIPWSDIGMPGMASSTLQFTGLSGIVPAAKIQKVREAFRGLVLFGLLIMFSLMIYRKVFS